MNAETENELEKMFELYPDTELLKFEDAREILGHEVSICSACPANYGEETEISCVALGCPAAKVYVSPVMYIVARVNKWGSDGI